MELIEKIVTITKEHNQLKIFQPPSANDGVSGICFFMNELRKNGYIIKGFAQAVPDSERPVIRKDPITNTYEIQMDIHCPIDECKRNFALVVLAIIQGPNFVSEVYDTISSIDDLFLEHKDLLIYYNKILSVL